MYRGRFNNRTTYLVSLADGIAIVLSFLFAYLLRFDFNIPSQHWNSFATSLLLIVPVKYLLFYSFGLYRSIYRYTSIWDGVKVLKASTTASLLIIVFYSFSFDFEGLNRSIFIMDYLLTTIFIGFVRVSVRFYYSTLRERVKY